MMIMKRFLLPALAASALATGCYAQGDVGTGYSYGYATTTGPDLYYLSPGVSVVAYSDSPTFYSDNAYWMYQDGNWYSSNYYGGGWNVSYNVPVGVRSINRPTAYTRFQPGQGWSRVSASGGYRGNTSYNANTSAPAAAYAAPRGGRPYSSGGYAPAARTTGGSTYSPPSRSSGGGGPIVRDHRHR